MRALGMLAVLFVAACSMYIPHPVDTPLPPGTQVRARLSTPGSVRLSTALGRPIQELEGEILSLDRDSLRLGLISARQYARPWDLVDTLSLATSEILQLEEKRINKTRTAFLVGGAGVVTGVVIAGLFRAATRSEDDEGGDEDLILIPFFTIIR